MSSWNNRNTTILSTMQDNLRKKVSKKQSFPYTYDEVENAIATSMEDAWEMMDDVEKVDLVILEIQSMKEAYAEAKEDLYSHMSKHNLLVFLENFSNQIYAVQQEIQRVTLTDYGGAGGRRCRLSELMREERKLIIMHDEIILKLRANKLVDSKYLYNTNTYMHIYDHNIYPLDRQIQVVENRIVDFSNFMRELTESSDAMAAESGEVPVEITESIIGWGGIIEQEQHNLFKLLQQKKLGMHAELYSSI